MHIAVTVVLYEYAVVARGDFDQLKAPRFRHHGAGRILVGRQRINEAWRPVLAVESSQALFESVHAHALVVDRHADHLVAHALERRDGARVAELLHDHNVVVVFAEVISNDSHTLHGAVHKRDVLGVDRNTFARAFALCHLRAQFRIAIAAWIETQLRT